jgi:hypothetical protein
MSSEWMDVGMRCGLCDDDCDEFVLLLFVTPSAFVLVLSVGVVGALLLLCVELKHALCEHLVRFAAITIMNAFFFNARHHNRSMNHCCSCNTLKHAASRIE